MLREGLLTTFDAQPAHTNAPAGPEQWLAAHGDVMWRYIMARVRNPELAEELIQETLVAALQARSAFRGECTERTWLLAILRRKMVDYVRRASREQRAAMEKQPKGDAYLGMFDQRGRWRLDPGRPPPESSLERPEFMRDFQRCLQKMPAGLAEAFVLREVNGRPAEAICAAMQITLDNLWVRLHRARVLLRRCLAGKWGPSPAPAPCTKEGGA